MIRFCHHYINPVHVGEILSSICNNKIIFCPQCTADYLVAHCIFLTLLWKQGSQVLSTPLRICMGNQVKMCSWLEINLFFYFLNVLNVDFFSTCTSDISSAASTKLKKWATCTHVDILQVQKVKYDAVSLPDDGWAQRPLDGACKDSAETHCYCRDTNLLVLRQAQLHNLCWNESMRETDYCGSRDRSYLKYVKMDKGRETGCQRTSHITISVLK